MSLIQKWAADGVIPFPSRPVEKKTDTEPHLYDPIGGDDGAPCAQCGWGANLYHHNPDRVAYWHSDKRHEDEARQQAEYDRQASNYGSLDPSIIRSIQERGVESSYCAHPAHRDGSENIFSANPKATAATHLGGGGHPLCEAHRGSLDHLRPAEEILRRDDAARSQGTSWDQRSDDLRRSRMRLAPPTSARAQHEAMGMSEHDQQNLAFPYDHEHPDHQRVYLRFGDWPEHERSTNWAMGHQEDGVSVYDLDKHGDPVDPDGAMDRDVHHHDESCYDSDGDKMCGLGEGEWDESLGRGNDTHGEMQDRVRKAERAFRNGVWDARNARAHLVTGDHAGFGHDDEPLLHNVRRVGDWIQHRHLFIPTAEKHPLALPEDSEDNAERREYIEHDHGEDLDHTALPKQPVHSSLLRHFALGPTPRKQPWTGPKYEDDPEGHEREYQRRRQEQDDYDAQGHRELTLGHIGHEEARAQGLWDEGQDRPWEPLPHTLYHVTTHLPQVLREGLKTPHELSQQGGHVTGLGGQNKHTISLTDDLGVAHRMHNALHEYHAMLNDPDAVKKMDDALADQPEHARLNYRSNCLGLPSPMDLHTDEHGQYSREPQMSQDEWHRQAIERTRQGLHPKTGQPESEEEQIRRRSDAFKGFSWMRPKVDGDMDPLILGNDPVGFAKSPRQNIGMVAVHPKPGAHGVRSGDPHEWKIGTGEAVHIGESFDRKPQPHRLALLLQHLASEEDYRGSHAAPDADDAPLHDLTPIAGEEIYKNPHFYMHGPQGDWYRRSEQASMGVAHRVRNKPDAKVTVYRAVPHDVHDINEHDWVALTPAYARQHARRTDSPKDDWKVLKASVPAKHVNWDGNDLNEWGYNGPTVSNATVHHPGGARAQEEYRQKQPDYWQSRIDDGLTLHQTHAVELPEHLHKMVRDPHVSRQEKVSAVAEHLREHPPVVMGHPVWHDDQTEAVKNAHGDWGPDSGRTKVTYRRRVTDPSEIYGGDGHHQVYLRTGLDYNHTRLDLHDMKNKPLGGAEIDHGLPSHIAMTQARPNPDPLEYQHEVQEGRWHSGIKETDEHHLYAYHPDSDQPVGHLKWWPGDAERGWKPEARNIEVHPDYRRQGIGAELMRRASEIEGAPLAASADRSEHGDAFARQMGKEHGVEVPENFRPDLATGERYYLMPPRKRVKARKQAKSDVDEIMDLLGPGVQPHQPQHDEHVREYYAEQRRQWQDARPGFNPGDDLSEMHPHAEWVPIEVAQKFREHGGQQGKARSGEDIEANLRAGRGMTDPLMLLHHSGIRNGEPIGERRASLGEGNHRLNAAERAGWTHVPMRVVNMTRFEARSGKGVPIPDGWHKPGVEETPEMARPSEVFHPSVLDKPIGTKDSEELTSKEGTRHGGAEAGASRLDLGRRASRRPGLDRPEGDRLAPRPAPRVLARLRRRAAGDDGLAPVEFHQRFEKDKARLAKTDKGLGQKIDETVEALRRGDPNLQTHDLRAPLKGWWATKVSRGHRMIHQPRNGGHYILGVIDHDDYRDMARRQAAARKPKKPRERNSYDMLDAPQHGDEITSPAASWDGGHGRRYNAETQQWHQVDYNGHALSGNAKSPEEMRSLVYRTDWEVDTPSQIHRGGQRGVARRDRERSEWLDKTHQRLDGHFLQGHIGVHAAEGGWEHITPRELHPGDDLGYIHPAAKVHYRQALEHEQRPSILVRHQDGHTAEIAQNPATGEHPDTEHVRQFLNSAHRAIEAAHGSRISPEEPVHFRVAHQYAEPDAWAHVAIAEGVSAHNSTRESRKGYHEMSRVVHVNNSLVRAHLPAPGMGGSTPAENLQRRQEADGAVPGRAAITDEDHPSAGVLLHELGHVDHARRQYDSQDPAFNSSGQRLHEKRQGLSSTYADTNWHEGYAESFAHHFGSRWYSKESGESRVPQTGNRNPLMHDLTGKRYAQHYNWPGAWD